MAKRIRKVDAVRAARAAPEPDQAPVPAAPAAVAVPAPETPARAPRISVLERRLVDPNQRSSVPITLKDEGVALRWINTSIDGRYHKARKEQGWEPVRREELADSDEIADLVESPDGWVRRGERGKEILMKMPKDIHDRIQERKVEVRRQRARSSSKQKEELLNRLANDRGSEAAEYVGRHMKGEILETVERETV